MLLILTFSSEAQRDAFDYIYNTYKRLMLHKAYGILHDYMLAEDAVSEAFIRIYKNIGKIEDPSSNSSIAFVMTIVKNVSLTMLEKEKNRWENQDDGAYENFDTLQTDSYDLENQVLGSISVDEIQRVIDSLNEELKSVFLLKFAHDLSHKEIGRLLNISENNVTVRLYRAKKRIAKLLKEGGYVHE